MVWKMLFEYLLFAKHDLEADQIWTNPGLVTLRILCVFCLLRHTNVSSYGARDKMEIHSPYMELTGYVLVRIRETLNLIQVSLNKIYHL